MSFTYKTKDIINIWTFIALAIVVLGSLFGSFLINIFNGIKKFIWPISIFIKSSKPLVKFTIPSLIGNILMGFFCKLFIKEIKNYKSIYFLFSINKVRNFLKKTIVMKYYSPFLGNKIRMLCLGVLLFRAGMHVEFKK